MKRQIAAILFVGAVFGAVAQKVPFCDTSRPDRMIEVGLDVGVGMSSMLQNMNTAVPEVSDFSFTPGCMTSFGVTAEMPVRNYFAIGTALNFNINNYSYNMVILHQEGRTLNSIVSQSHFYNLDVPVFFDFRFNLGNKVRWHNEVGGYLSFGAGGNTKTRSYVSSTNALGQSQVTEIYYKRDYFNDNQSVINGVNSLDWGLHLATGIVACRHVMLKAVLHVGARDLACNYGVLKIENHTLNLSFKAGYVF